MREILLVHDHQESPALRKGYLEVSGYAVALASNGADALERIERKRPALVLMDVLIDGPNGFEICRRMRGKWGPNELPIVLTSGVYRSRIYRDEATAAGAQGYVLKPCEPDELVREISAILARIDARKGAGAPA
jgi:DNA-binding response OmpR family regulator